MGSPLLLRRSVIAPPRDERHHDYRNTGRNDGKRDRCAKELCGTHAGEHVRCHHPVASLSRAKAKRAAEIAEAAVGWLSEP